jgi:uncharacterized protein YecT (DUF1311 family)
LILPFLASGQDLNKEHAKAEFDRSNRQLNQAWQSLMKDYSDFAATYGDSGHQRDKSKFEQEHWLRYRDMTAASSYLSGNEEVGKKAKQNLPYYRAAAEMNRDRAKWLQGLLKDPESEKTMTGRWYDSYNGCLRIIQEGSKLYFSINAVRGDFAHLGRIGGTAYWNKSVGWYSDKGKKWAGSDEANIVFILENGRLEVSEANTDSYNGAGSYFAGNYVRVAKLTPKEITRLKEVVAEFEP